MKQVVDAPTHVPTYGRVRKTVATLSSAAGWRPWTLVGIGLLSAAAGITEAIALALISHTAVAMSSSVDHPLSLGPIDLAMPISALLLIAGLLAGARLGFQIILARLPVSLSGEIQTRLRTRLTSTYLRAEWSQKQAEKGGHLQELIGSQTVQAGNAVINLATELSAGLMFLALAGSAFVLSPLVALGVMISAAALFGVLRPISVRVRQGSAHTSASSVALAVGVAETVRLAESLQVFGAEGAEESRLTHLTLDVEANFVRTRTLARIVPVAYQGIALILIVGGLYVLHSLDVDAQRLAALGTVVLLLIRASSYGQQLQVAHQGVGEALPYIERLDAASARFQDSERSRGHLRIESIATMEFESVCFSYRERAPALRDVSFGISGGETIGIVGPSGAGKSTLVQLLLRLRYPDAGGYRINGEASLEIAEASWQRLVAYLPQEPQLVHASVAENIRFFRGWVSDEAIERAARLSHIHGEVMSWPEGYSTAVGHSIEALSVGERQRLCLARALAGDPSLLILDEPTSSLDSRSEQLIQESLAQLRGSMTVVVVAHRLSTLRVCDRIMVIQDGRLEAFGPGDHLYASNDFYRHSIDLAAAHQSA